MKPDLTTFFDQKLSSDWDIKQLKTVLIVFMWHLEAGSEKADMVIFVLIVFELITISALNAIIWQIQKIIKHLVKSCS